MTAVEQRAPGRFSSHDRATRPKSPPRSASDEEATEQDAAESLLTDEQKATIRLLIVDDEESFLESTASILEDDNYQVTAVQRGSAADSRVRESRYDIILLDLYMSGVPGTYLLRTALEKNPDTVVIVMTGRPSIKSSIQALRDGAWDYLPKPFSATQLRILVGRAAHAVMVGRESAELEAAEQAVPEDDSSTLLGESPLFRGVVALALKVATTDASVFITGESGTGKEMVAQYIHRMSRRKSRDLVAVNCAALPEPLLESEMFGHVKGAFTSATRDKVGLMEIASGGTLFLDELTEMSPMTQAKLLRVVQDGVLRRVGSSKTDAIVNVRFISATNRDPSKAVADGRLREDLYYRLGVVPIHIPALRERPEDIPILAKHFLEAYWERHRGGGLPAPTFTPDAIEDLRSRPWKGNVRELQNVIEHAIVLVEERGEIDAADLPLLEPKQAGHVPLQGSYMGPGVPLSGYHQTRDRVVARFEREYLRNVLQETEGNVSEAARVAGVNRATLYRMLERHGLSKGDVVN
ncbi:MAG TPA: sigma-54 dependent transcriptional regulator [Longimicrobiales bacterium]|nr:sigma-54 dependent transcriptional regulator [Longimicrobiales bacterium]